MPRVMKHAWVTRSGHWPLRTVREMIRAGDTIGDDEAPEMPDFMSTLNVLDIPRQVLACLGCLTKVEFGCCKLRQAGSGQPTCCWQAKRLLR